MLTVLPDKDAQEFPLGVRLKVQLRGDQNTYNTSCRGINELMHLT